MSILETPPVLKTRIEELVGELQALVEGAATEGRPVHEVERGVWRLVLRLGHSCLGRFLALQGDGDMGPTIRADDGREWRRLAEPHSRRYVSLFGVFEIDRAVYGRREGRKIEFVPLDNRLRLPESAYSYVLQDWSQELCVESAFGQVSATLERMLGLTVPVDSLERLNARMAEGVEAYRRDRPAPAAEEEGELVVASADGKGVVMRRSAEDPAPAAHRSKGEKASRMRMATVASVYTVDRHARTARDVVAALFRDGGEPSAPRPRPRNKRVWASLGQVDAAGRTSMSGIDAAHQGLMDELVERNRRGQARVRPMVFLYDGQESLWEARRRHLPGAGVDVLDLPHVTPRLWQAAHVFHPEGSAAAEAFVRDRCLRVLEGRVDGVVRGLREMATKRRLGAASKRALGRVCGYFEKNRERMRYDEYLAAGFPIASGVIEGACRHLVKDRMERAGMHWTPRGAQAMLDVRSVHIDGAWDEYQTYRIDRATRKLYPHRRLVEGASYKLAC